MNPATGHSPRSACFNTEAYEQAWLTGSSLSANSTHESVLTLVIGDRRLRRPCLEPKELSPMKNLVYSNFVASITTTLLPAVDA
jgi:hypothetical protein